MCGVVFRSLKYQSVRSVCAFWKPVKSSTTKSKSAKVTATSNTSLEFIIFPLTPCHCTCQSLSLFIWAFVTLWGVPVILSSPCMSLTQNDLLNSSEETAAGHTADMINPQFVSAPYDELVDSPSVTHWSVLAAREVWSTPVNTVCSSAHPVPLFFLPVDVYLLLVALLLTLNKWIITVAPSLSC